MRGAVGAPLGGPFDFAGRAPTLFLSAATALPVRDTGILLAAMDFDFALDMIVP